VCERRVNLLVYSLSLHRHSYIGFILALASSIHNKQTVRLSTAPDILPDIRNEDWGPYTFEDLFGRRHDFLVGASSGRRSCRQECFLSRYLRRHLSTAVTKWLPTSGAPPAGSVLSRLKRTSRPRDGSWPPGLHNCGDLLFTINFSPSEFKCEITFLWTMQV
jgi:hypothetical protein